MDLYAESVKPSVANILSGIVKHDNVNSKEKVGSITNKLLIYMI